MGALLLWLAVGGASALPAGPHPPAAFAFEHGLVCERDEKGYGVDLHDTTCADPIGGARVEVRDSLGHTKAVKTDAKGVFSFAEPFPMDGRTYSISVGAYGYSGLDLDQVQRMTPARSASQIQVVFGLPAPERGPDWDSAPLLYCGHGIRYLLHSGVKADNSCRMRGADKLCFSASRADAYAEASCEEGCRNTGGPGFCCQVGTAGCELERLLEQVEEPSKSE